MIKYLLVAVVLVCGVFFFTQKTSAGNKIDYAGLQQLLQGSAPVVLLDVRTAQEFAGGHLPGAVLLPHDEVEQKAADLLPDKEQTIVVYCRSGRRSSMAAAVLTKLGYSNVYDFGAVDNWQGPLER